MTDVKTMACQRTAAAKLADFAADIKIAHTIFAMPFALLSAILAWTIVRGPIGGKVLLILACMVCARTVAMAANRLMDARLDAINPRTARRAIPSGRLSARFFAAAIALCAAGFVAGAAGFLAYHNPWPLYLSGPVLLFLSAYPLLKRFTWLCHWYLGAALGLAPLCAWVAIGAPLAWPPLLLGGAVLMWTAGFDIIYACQDYDNDRATGTFSIPAAMGIGPALWVSRAVHVISAALLVGVGLCTRQLGMLYFVGVAAAVLLLVVEHSLVRADDLSKVGVAFFTVNGVISLLLGTLGIVSALSMSQ